MTAMDAGNRTVQAPRKLLEAALACMRETGWHLAPAAAPISDGVLGAACSEVEAQLRELLDDAP